MTKRSNLELNKASARFIRRYRTLKAQTQTSLNSIINIFIRIAMDVYIAGTSQRGPILSAMYAAPISSIMCLRGLTSQ